MSFYIKNNQYNILNIIFFMMENEFVSQFSVMHEKLNKSVACEFKETVVKNQKALISISLQLHKELLISFYRQNNQHAHIH